MKRFMETIFCIFILLMPFGCHEDSNKKAVYELQERCGKTAVQWSKQHTEVLDYRAHYNAHLNKCIILATLAPIALNNVTSSYYMLYDVNANNTLGQYTVRSYPNSEDHICIINGENYGKDSKEKWNSFVKKMMEE